MIRNVTLALILLVGLAAVQIAFPPAEPSSRTFTGPVSFRDGDSLMVGDIETRLHGIDAPEFNQTCEDANGTPWPCGRQIRGALRDLYQGDTAVCTLVEHDRYGRAVAKCSVAGQDLGETIVANGWAEAYRRYSMDYDLTEKAAQVAGVGIWAGSHESPAAYRADHN